MTVLSYQSIKKLSLRECEENALIYPYQDNMSSFHGVSRGTTHAGYDLTCEFDEEGVKHKLVIPPKCFSSQIATIERLNLPDYLLANIMDKSSWIRQGLFLGNTAVEPNWRGHLTIEVFNASDKPITLYRGMGICQIVFHKLDTPTEHPYPEDGKYQNQKRGPVAAILED